MTSYANFVYDEKKKGTERTMQMPVVTPELIASREEIIRSTGFGATMTAAMARWTLSVASTLDQIVAARMVAAGVWGVTAATADGLCAHQEETVPTNDRFGGQATDIATTPPTVDEIVAARVAAEEETMANEEAWNGNAYRVTIVATVEANTPEEAQCITGELLASEPLSGWGSWAPETKTVELISSRIEAAIAYAGKLGAEHGAMAASWVEIGDASQARKILAGIDDIDPEIMDWLPAADLSGQWADGLSATDLYNAVSDHLELGETDDDTYHALRDAICDAFEGEYASAVEYVVAETCRRMLEAS